MNLFIYYNIFDINTNQNLINIKYNKIFVNK